MASTLVNDVIFRVKISQPCNQSDCSVKKIYCVSTTHELHAVDPNSEIAKYLNYVWKLNT